MTQPRPASSRQFATQLEIAAPRDAVWNAITNDVELRRWFPTEARIDPRVGGELVWGWKGLHTWVQKIDIWEPGTRLRTRYDSPVEDGRGGRVPLFVDFLLEGSGGKTTLRLVHSGFGPESSFDGEYDGISRGWPVELESLRLYLERHAGMDRQLAWRTMSIDVAPDEAWRRLTSDQGLACGPKLDELRAGEKFRFRTAAGDLFEGHALHCHRREFSGVASSHGDGFIRIAVERCTGEPMVWLWLATYGQPQANIEALAQRWDAMLHGLFAAQRESAHLAQA